MLHKKAASFDPWLDIVARCEDGGVEYEAFLGGDTVQGVSDSPPYAYSFNMAFAAAPQVALTTLAGMDGPNGGWAQTDGSTLATTTSLYLSIDEDQVGDTERNHITEQVGYVVFGAAAYSAPVAMHDAASTHKDAADPAWVEGYPLRY